MSRASSSNSVRRAADAAPGPLSALAAAVTTIAVDVLSQRKLAWGILAEPIDVDVTSSRIDSRKAIVAEIETRIAAAARAGHLPAQDASLTAAALIGALHEALVGPLAPDNLDDPLRLRDAVQTLTLMALRAVGVMDARARGLVVQAVLPVTPEPKAAADSRAGVGVSFARPRPGDQVRGDRNGAEDARGR